MSRPPQLHGCAARNGRFDPCAFGSRGASLDVVSIFVWVMIGIGIWHACVLVPDRFYGGLVGAFLTAVVGASVSGFLLPAPHNPPGFEQALWPIPGCVLALAALYVYGIHRDRQTYR
jgi:hypothetical protein